MIDPVTMMGQTPTYPLRICHFTGPGYRTNPCKVAMDSRGLFVYRRAMFSQKVLPIEWSDIQNEPGWQNGYPPQWNGQTIELTGYTVTSGNLTIKDTCDCGMAASHYSVSRDGGPGHSSWCKVANK